MATQAEHVHTLRACVDAIEMVLRAAFQSVDAPIRQRAAAVALAELDGAHAPYTVQNAGQIKSATRGFIAFLTATDGDTA